MITDLPSGGINTYMYIYKPYTTSKQTMGLWASLYYPIINTDNYATVGNTYDLQQHELTTGTNVPIYALLLARIHTKDESEKSKYINGITFPDHVLYMNNLSVFLK